MPTLQQCRDVDVRAERVLLKNNISQKYVKLPLGTASKYLKATHHAVGC